MFPIIQKKSLPAEGRLSFVPISVYEIENFCKRSVVPVNSVLK
jgi:hypothetical protein